MAVAKLSPSRIRTVAAGDPVTWALSFAILMTAVHGPRSYAGQEQTDSAQQPPLLRLLRESRAPYHTVAVQFTQTKRLAILDVTLKSEGMIFFRRPGLIRYEIISPVRSLLLHDTKKAQCYAFTEGRWELLRSPGATAVGRVLRQIGHWIQGDFDTDQKMFHLTVLPWEQGAGCIRLTPRSEGLAEYIQGVSIYVDEAPDYQVRRVVIHESDIDTTELLFRRERRNKPIPERTFVSPDASEACVDFFRQTQQDDPNDVETPPS
jgi:outer membrane lipoprotein-sorting protein